MANWSSLAGRGFGLVLLICGPFLWAEAQEKLIHLRTGRIRTVPEMGRTAELQAAAAQRLFLLQFEGRVLPEWRREIEALGVELIRYVPEDAFVADLSHVRPGQVRGLGFVRWVGPYRAEHKLHPRLRAHELKPALAPEDIPVSILLAEQASAEESASIRRLLRGVGKESRLRWGTILRGILPLARLADVAGLDAVLWVEPAPRMRLLDEVSSKIVGGDDGYRSTPTVTQRLGYDGRGVLVAIADSGLDSGDPNDLHPDLAGRVKAFQFYGSLADGSDEHSHGTHVAGIIAGSAAYGETDELGALYGLGVAPGAELVVQRIFDGVGNYQAPPTFETLTRDAVRAGAVIGNNSWGDDVQGRYDLSAAEFDELVRDADFLAPGDQPYVLEFSSGNAGPAAQTMASPAVAKNVIASGASQNDRLDFFIFAEGIEAMADFSSRGPCEDGRIKPDVVAPGTWIASLRSVYADDNNAWADISSHYMYQGGTSQAGPHVSGAAAVFVQYYRDVYGVTPSPALVKAALINSAVDLDDEFGTAPVPNPDEGWGRVDLTEMIGSGRSFVFVDQTELLGVGETYETAVVVADSSGPLKITLVYTDVPGFPGAVPALVNDLDLEVIGPDEARYLGNRFEDGDSIPNASIPDTINNVEGVHLLEPRPGPYRIRVQARNVPEDARLDSAAVDQDFALVASGLTLPGGESLVYLDREVYTAPDRLRVGVVDRDLAGADSAPVVVRSDTEPSGQTLVLTAKGTDGVFTNSILTLTGAPEDDGQLQVAHGDLLEVGYQDASMGTLRTTTAAADLVPPVISAVESTNRFGRAFVTWTTDEFADSRVDYGTSSALGLSASDPGWTENHAIGLEGLLPEQTYFWQVVSADEAGNTATNNNDGAFYTLTAPDAPPVLVVDAFYDDLLLDPPPLATYTDPLLALGVAFDVWEHQGEGSPALADLRPYRAVLWRLPEFGFTYATFTEAEQTAIRDYLDEGGSLFVASMEVLTRLDEAGASAFRSDVLEVPSFVTDATVPSITGIEGDIIGDSLSFALSYPSIPGWGELDASDTITPSADAAGILAEAVSGDFAGLRFPKTGVDSPGRLVFLGFPWDAIPETGSAPNNRTEVLRRILQFLVPGVTGEATVVLDRPAYTLPALITLEVGDTDLEGAGQVEVTATTTSEPDGTAFLLPETPRPGLFRGQILLVDATNAPVAGRLRGAEGDAIAINYLDASAGRSVRASAVVDTVPPSILGLFSKVDYSTATVSWETGEAADALVQYGESLPLPINRTQFDPSLTLDHTVTLAGLQHDRMYYYQVVSRDAAGNATVDDNQGQYYTLRTLQPLEPPFADDLESSALEWALFSGDESQTRWTLGTPNNGIETAAHSGVNAWGSVLTGAPVSLADTFLIGPAIHLINGNQITLRFWHRYDFTPRSEYDLLEGGQVLLVQDTGNVAIPLAVYFESNDGWEQEALDLTPYLGQVVYLVWHHQLLSFDSLPRPGWLIDDIEVAVETILPGTITVTNNLSQASFGLAGPTARVGVGASLVVTNAPPGEYVVTFNPVPYYQEPPPQTNILIAGGSLLFSGWYTFADSNANAISDAWEEDVLGAVNPGHPPDTDSDGDGADDYAEFVAGTDPTRATSNLALDLDVQPNRLLRLEWPAVPGRSYRLLQTTDLTTWTPVNDWTRAAGATFSYLFSPPGIGSYYRLEVRP